MLVAGTRVTKVPDPMRSDPTDYWSLPGFDCSLLNPNDAEAVVFRPNRHRSFSEGSAVFGIVLFLTLWGAMPMLMWLSIVGVIPLASDPPSNPPFWQQIWIGLLCTLLAWGPFTVVFLGIYILIHDYVLHRSTPITLDRRNDALRFGDRKVCSLSDIREVTLQQILPDGNGKYRLGVSLRMKGGRRIPRKVMPGQILRYDLGEHDLAATQNFETILGEVAGFVGSDYRISSERPQSAGKGMA